MNGKPQIPGYVGETLGNQMDNEMEAGEHIRQLPKLRGPQYRPHYSIILVTGAPKKVLLIFGNSHMGNIGTVYCSPETPGLGPSV